MYMYLFCDEYMYLCIKHVSNILLLLAKALRESKMLTSFGLRECGLGLEGLSEVCSSAEIGMSSLTSLDLSKNKFDKQSIASLGELLVIMIYSRVNQLCNRTIHVSHECIVIYVLKLVIR